MAGAKAAGSNALRFMAAGWGVFTGSHLVMSHPPVRDALVQALGDEKKFLGMYSAVAAASFFPTTFVYLRYGRGVGKLPAWTDLTQSSWAVRGLGLTAKAAAGVMFGQAIGTKNEADIMERKKGLSEGGSSQAEAKACEPKGIFRITRHPLFTSLALLGVGNMLLRGFTGDVVYWSGYVLIWAVGCPHQDYRMKLTGVQPKEYLDNTSFLPFAAIAAGKQNFKQAFDEFNKPVLATSLFVPLFFL